MLEAEQPVHIIATNKSPQASIKALYLAMIYIDS
jgi:hypothetical protein